jgi:hypothetical protein
MTTYQDQPRAGRLRPNAAFTPQPYILIAWQAPGANNPEQTVSVKHGSRKLLLAGTAVLAFPRPAISAGNLDHGPVRGFDRGCLRPGG